MKVYQPKTTYLHDYLAPDYLIEKIDLFVDLFDDKVLVRSIMQINRNEMSGQHQRPLVLNGEDLTLISVKVDGNTLHVTDYQKDERTLTLNIDKPHFELEITTEIYPQLNTTLSGLYRSNKLFCTQCEAEGFRRITYYLDRPDVMSTFTTTISANKQQYPVLLSNGNPISKGEEAERHWVTWEDPFKKPAYLFALVAGDLVEITDYFTTMSGRKVKLSIFVEAENKDKCDYAMASLKHAMKWDEERYGLEYDLDIYMIVAVKDFNMGAMENKGLNVFNAKYVLADSQTATDADFMGVEMVIGHEYFHNWTGNRVTLRDWFQLSLKEGLTVFREQQFSQESGSAAVKRIEDVKQIRTRQFAEDSGPIAHPVRPDSYIEINNFYTMTIYYKGAEVIRMLHTLLGESSFRKGMDLYFSRHDGQAVIIEDLINALKDASPNESLVDFNQFMRWYSQAGTPIINVEQKKEGDTVTLTFTQSCPPTPGQKTKKPFVMPIKINLYDTMSGQLIDLAKHPKIKQTETGCYFVLSKEEDTLVIEGQTKEVIPSLLGGFSAPVKVEYDYQPTDLAFIIQHDEDGFSRWDKSQVLTSTVVKNLILDQKSNESVTLPDLFKDIYHSLLNDQKTEPALLAQLISLPSFYYIAEELDIIPVEKLNHILTGLKKAVAIEFKDILAQRYLLSHEQDTGLFEPDSVGHRSLKNTCLSMLGRLQDEQYIKWIEAQYRHARNMTDSMGALWAINHVNHPLREQLFDDFYHKWQKDSLVVDKWLSLQAQSELPNTLESIQGLMNHPAFDIKTPNKVYALLRSLGASNPVCFHEASGKGYAFLAKQVIALNEQNPQVAARILEPLTQFKRLDEKHAHLMRLALELIQAEEKLSEDVFEIVSKSLT